MANVVRRLVSADGSINFIIPYAKSFIEARYVQRAPNYISAYVSSHNGCKMGCTFCWLTSQNQTEFKHVGIKEYQQQLQTILENVPEDKVTGKSKVRINVNFMGRGEALANKNVVTAYPQLYDTLLQTVKDNNFGSLKMNVSTIMPHAIQNRSIIDIVHDKPINIYYSLYSVNDDIKKQLMPSAMDWRKALDNLALFQQDSSSHKDNSVVFHGAFIKGINDSEESVSSLVDEILKRPFSRTKFNMVRFNPPPKSQFEETSIERLQEIFTFISSKMKDHEMNKKSTIIDRVGYDAFVSCGMFPRDDDI